MQTATNPATGEVIKQYEEHTPEQVQQIIDQSHSCYLSWSKTPLPERRAKILKAIDVLLERKKNSANSFPWKWANL